METLLHLTSSSPSWLAYLSRFKGCLLLLFHIPIVVSFQKYLHWVKAICSLLTHLSFGLSPSSSIFTKVLLAVVALIKKSIHLCRYLDNLLLFSQGKDLQEFAWLVKIEKSHLTPTQNFVFMGVQFNMIQNMIFLLPEKIPVVRSWIALAFSSFHLSVSDVLYCSYSEQCSPLTLLWRSGGGCTLPRGFSPAMHKTIWEQSFQLLLDISVPTT